MSGSTASPDDRRRPTRRTTRLSTSFDSERGVFMISVAAELAEMHPQTLRMYEAKGLIAPKRSPKNTRLYSQQDVERLQRIQEMTAEQGLNLAGVETVLELEAKLERMAGELRRMRERTAEMEERMASELERARAMRAELVPYRAYESDRIGGKSGAERAQPHSSPGQSQPPTGSRRIPVERKRRGGGGSAP